MKMNRTLLVIIIVLLLALILPFLGTSRYTESLLNNIFVFVILAESFAIMAGYMGYLNLGHTAFFGLGSYTFAIFLLRGAGAYPALAVATASGPVFALFIGFPLLRLKGAYFAVGSLAIVNLLFLLSFNLEDLTGGYQGLPFPADDVHTQARFLLIPAVLASTITNFRLQRSSFGLALRCIKENETVAMGLGIDLFRLKIKALVLSSVFASFAGGIYAWYNSYVNPESAFGLTVTFLPVAMALLGGASYFVGPPIGVLLLTLLQEFFWRSFIHFRLLTFGIVFLLVGLLMPKGLMEVLNRGREKDGTVIMDA